MSDHTTTPVLETAAAEFAAATADPPYLFDLGPVEGRKTVDEVQSGEIDKPQVDEEWITVSGGPTGSVRARIARPAPPGPCPSSSTSTAPAGCSATPTPTTAWSASSPPA
ncbi:hypothetical protein [Sphaerimonospora mesophila]|uniref:hypothetical protein n=1 Tax=Sphaerimonospora mesophila TaxID=37483 RepID=UPI000B0CA83F